MGLLSFHASTPVCKQANVGVTITPFISPVLGAGKENNSYEALRTAVDTW